eukprot:10546089-Ditylum_brightwellii.AAC.2
MSPLTWKKTPRTVYSLEIMASTTLTSSRSQLSFKPENNGYIIELTNKTNEATKAIEKQKEEAAKERFETKSTLDKLVAEKKEVSKKSAGIEERRKALDENL